jgi:hypothetical protein
VVLPKVEVGAGKKEVSEQSHKERNTSQIRSKVYEKD